MNFGYERRCHSRGGAADSSQMSSVLCHDFVQEVQEEVFQAEEAQAQDAVPFSQESGLSIAIINGKIVDADQTLECDILVEDGKIVRVDKNLDIPDGTKVIDAVDKYILPGFINIDQRNGLSCDVFNARSEASIKAGVTSILELASEESEKCSEFLEAAKDDETMRFYSNLCVRAKASLSQVNQLHQIFSCGVNSVQVSPEEMLTCDDEELLQSFKDIRAQGLVLGLDLKQGVLENNVLEGKSLCIPTEDLEEMVVRKVCSLALQVDIVVCLLGLGSPDSLDLLEYYRGEGLRVYAVLDAGHASLVDMPLNQDNLILASNPQDYEAEESWTSSMYNKLVEKEIVDISRFVQLTSAGPARLTNQFPRKGCIRVDSDADLVVWDPMRATEQAEHVLVAGRIVVSDGQLRPMARAGQLTSLPRCAARPEGCRQVREPLVSRLDCPGSAAAPGSGGGQESPRGGRRSGWDRRKASSTPNEIFDKELGIHQRPRSAHGVKNQQDSTFTVKTFF